MTAERPDSFFPQLFSLYTLSFIFSLLLVSLSGGRKERERKGVPEAVRGGYRGPSVGSEPAETCQWGLLGEKSPDKKGLSPTDSSAAQGADGGVVVCAVARLQVIGLRFRRSKPCFGKLQVRKSSVCKGLRRFWRHPAPPVSGGLTASP